MRDKKMTKEMTKDELMARIVELEKTNENLEKTKGQTMKSKVFSLIESGFNCIEDLAEELKITSKNVSSNLTYIRADLKEAGKTIVSQRINQKTMIAVVELETLNW